MASKTLDPPASAMATAANSSMTLEDEVEKGGVMHGSDPAGAAAFSGDETDRAAPDGGRPPPRTAAGVKWALIMASIYSAAFLFALDNTVVADVQPQIVLQFDAVARIAWLSVAFIMAAVGTTLWFGQLYSRFWPKWLFVGSVGVFEVGSAVCGAAPNMSTLIVGRALCGVGGIGLYLGVMSLITLTTSVQERPLYIAGTGLTWGLGTILGPVVGGAFAESSATWRWAFYINLPIGAVCAPIYLFLLPSPDTGRGMTVSERFRGLDYVGAVLMLGAVVSFVMAINFGGVLYEWNSATEIALFVVAGVLFLLLTLQQAFSLGTSRATRLFPVDFVTNPKSARTVLLMFCVTACGGAGIFLPVYFIPLFFQFARGDSAVEAAVRLLPYIAVMIFVTLLMGGLLSLPSGKFSLYWVWFLVGGCLTVAGGVLMYKVDIDSSDAWVYGASSLVAAGVGTFTQSGFAIAQASVPEEEGSAAAAFIALGQTAGITFALAIGNAVFINRAETSLQDIVPGLTKEQVQTAIAGLGTGLVKSLPADLQGRVLEAIVDAVSRTYILLITAGAMVVVFSLLMKKEKLFIQAAGGM